MDQVKTIVSKYPRVIMTTGHSHFSLDIASRDDNSPTYVNTAAVGYNNYDY